MQWSDVSLQPAHRTLRQFAALWIVFFLGLAGLNIFWWSKPVVAIAFVVAAITVGPLGLVKPAAVRWIYVGWMLLAFPIGWTVSRLTLALLFYGVFTPIGIVFRVIGRDALQRRSGRSMESYWTPRAMPQDVGSYFRQS